MQLLIGIQMFDLCRFSSVPVTKRWGRKAEKKEEVLWWWQKDAGANSQQSLFVLSPWSSWTFLSVLAV